MGVSKGQLQKLTARAKTSVSSPSEVHMLQAGQLPRTRTSIFSTDSKVLLEELIVLHMVAAALRGQSSVSAGSQPQCHGLGNSKSQVTKPQHLEEQGGHKGAGSVAGMPGM